MSELASISLTYYGALPSKSNFRKANTQAARAQWARIKATQEDLGMLALAAGARPLYREMPVSVSARLIGQRLDVDNSAKVILDALEGVCYEDDKQVFRWEVERVHDEYPCSPRVELTIGWHSKVPGVNSGKVTV